MLIPYSDLPAFEAHVLRVANAGVGPLITGSMGEAIHLSHSERVKLIVTARKALDGAGFTQVPIIAGTGAGSTRETIELTNEAAVAGADYAIVITSGYFAGPLASNRAALKAFFVEVSEKSSIPVMIYNCAFLPTAPRCCTNIFKTPVHLGELISTLILSQNWLKIAPIFVGSNLREYLTQPSAAVHYLIFQYSCGNVGKLTRIADAIAAPNFTSLHPRKNPNAPFLVLGGFIDFLIPSAFANGHGAITGLANLAPVCLALFSAGNSVEPVP